MKLPKKLPKSDAVGTSCDFIDLKNGFGLKIYRSRKIRNRHYLGAIWAANLGFGPKTGIRVKIGNKYGYITEVIEPLIPYSTEHVGGDNFEKEYLPLCDIVEKATNVRLYCDAHDGNFGRAKCGKILWLDSGDRCNWENRKKHVRTLAD